MIEQKELEEHLKVIREAGYEINPPSFLRLQGWNNILMQLTMARFFLDTLKGLPDNLGDLENIFTRNAFFIAFLTMYGKCFTGAGGHRISLDQKNAFKHQNQDIIEGHERIMALRHTFAAHNSDSGLVVTTMAAKDAGGIVHLQHLVTQAMPIGEFDKFSAVMEALEEYVTMRLNMRLNKIEAQMGKAINLD